MDPEHDPEPVTHSDLERLRARRAARRQRDRRRRRLIAAVIALLSIAAVAVAVTLALGGGGSTSPRADAGKAPAASGTGPGNQHSPAPADAGAAATAGAAASAAAAGSGGQADSSGATAAIHHHRRPGTTPVPVLMYHVIAAPPPNAPFPGLYVTADEFAAQMHALAAAGWRAVTLDQVAAYWREGTPLGTGHPIVISFDNGYQSQFSNALPILSRLKWRGDLNLQLTGLPPSEGGLSRREVRSLVSDGWELDTQGFSHADLVTLDPAQLRYQVKTARRVMQERYHVAANWFCYPSGHYNATVIDAVRSAGYKGSTTTVPGWASASQDPYRLERLRVLGGTSPASLLALIGGTRHNGPPPVSYDGGTI